MEISFTNSKIFLYFCLSFVLGILIASFIKVPPAGLFAAAIFAVILISVFWRNKKLVIAGFSIIFIILGVWRYQSVSDSQGFLNRPNNSSENIIFQGVVSDEPDIRIKDTRYVVANKDFGKILITMPHYPAYKYGDLVEFNGKLKSPESFNSFDYAGYLAKDGIYSTMYSPKTKLISSGQGGPAYILIFKVKDKFREKLKAAIADPESSLVSGLLLGDRSSMTEKLKNDFAATGTSHIVAVSGFNVTIIAVIILEVALLIGFSRTQSFWISLAAIILFIIMVGAPASAVRAGIMGGLLLLAIKTGRLNSFLNAIVLAAVLMIAANPKILRFDIGFLLSFLAVMGIIWLYPILDHYFQKIPDTLKIKSILLLTLSAQIMTLPVLIYNFDKMSLVAPLANVLILPFVPIAMILGFLSATFGFVWLELAKLVGYFAWLVLTYQLRTIEYLASFYWAAAEIKNFNSVLFVLYYLIIAIILVKGRHRKVQY
ncbi:competence protein ComEC family protein [Patescibacteria group bacterium]|nr:competence protein ComEC family protein [Patescibacteria group bacterium]MBU3999815.1 competence protein ComEC family protein [Patescibacteria group bacterium]MBU4056324.1 competence protein ComEC family protein [Patescibacteria group bacterium]MBU4368771.1 competence protein ComEC family protein [Patescibacteria group bacterium]